MQMHAFRAFVDPAWGLAFSADGRSFAAGGHNRDLKIWDTSDWAEKELLRGHSSTVHCLAFSPDGRRLVSGARTIWPWSGRPARITGRKKCPNCCVDRNGGSHAGHRLFPRQPAVCRHCGGRHGQGLAHGHHRNCRLVSDEARTVAFSADGKSVLNEGYTASCGAGSWADMNPGRRSIPRPVSPTGRSIPSRPRNGSPCGRPARNPGPVPACAKSPVPARHQWRGDAYHAHDRPCHPMERPCLSACRRAAWRHGMWPHASGVSLFARTSLMSRARRLGRRAIPGHRQPGQFNQALGRRHWPISRDFP